MAASRGSGNRLGISSMTLRTELCRALAGGQLEAPYGRPPALEHTRHGSRPHLASPPCSWLTDLPALHLPTSFPTAALPASLGLTVGATHLATGLTSWASGSAPLGSPWGFRLPQANTPDVCPCPPPAPALHFRLIRSWEQEGACSNLVRAKPRLEVGRLWKVFSATSVVQMKTLMSQPAGYQVVPSPSRL